MYDRYYQGRTRSHPRRERMTESHGAGKLARRVRRGGCGNVQLARVATRRVLTQSMDGALTKAPLGGEKTGPNPTDRGKSGVKRSLLTEGHGVPIGLVAEGANRHARKLTRAPVESLIVERPEPTAERPQGMCLDAGYDYDEVDAILKEFGFSAHVRPRGEEAKAIKHVAGFKARRWVVERAHSWMNRFRRLLIRWDKKPQNYLAFLHFACGLIAFRAAGVFG